MNKGIRWLLLLLVTGFISFSLWHWTAPMLAPYFAQTDSAKKPIKVTIKLNWYPDGEHAYLYLAKEHLFPDNGFDVEISGGTGSDLSAKLTAAGNSDFGLMGPDALLGVVQQGGKLLSVGVLYDRTPVVIYSPIKENITDLTQLKGKIGVLLGSNTYIQYKGLEKKGLIKSDDVKDVPVDGRSGPEKLDAGELDTLTYYGHYVDAREVELGNKYNQIHFSKYLPNLYGMVLAINEDTMQRLGRENVKIFVDLIKQSLLKARENPKEAINALKRANEGKIKNDNAEQAKLESVLKMACKEEGSGCSHALEQTPEGWKGTAQTVKELGIIKDEELWRSVLDSPPSK